MIYVFIGLAILLVLFLYCACKLSSIYSGLEENQENEHFTRIRKNKKRYR